MDFRDLIKEAYTGVLDQEEQSLFEKYSYNEEAVKEKRINEVNKLSESEIDFLQQKIQSTKDEIKDAQALSRYVGAETQLNLAEKLVLLRIFVKQEEILNITWQGMGIKYTRLANNKFSIVLVNSSFQGKNNFQIVLPSLKTAKAISSIHDIKTKESVLYNVFADYDVIDLFILECLRDLEGNKIFSSKEEIETLETPLELIRFFRELVIPVFLPFCISGE